MKNKCILIIEDEKNIQTLVKYNLEQAGFDISASRRGDEGLKRALTEKPDLIILDLMLPGKDGLEVCKELQQDKRTSHIPIIMLTAKGEEGDKILGLELGADDYITKPFSPKELVARVRAKLRRNQKEDQSNLLMAGKIALDLERHKATLKSKPIDFTHKEFNLLKTLMEVEGRTLSRDQLLNRVWGYERSIEIESRTVDIHIAQLRKKIASEAHRIVTVKNEGYRFDHD